jgi:hypothetical protein
MPPLHLIVRFVHPVRRLALSSFNPRLFYALILSCARRPNERLLTQPTPPLLTLNKNTPIIIFLHFRIIALPIIDLYIRHQRDFFSIDD